MKIRAICPSELEKEPFRNNHLEASKHLNYSSMAEKFVTTQSSSIKHEINSVMKSI